MVIVLNSMEIPATVLATLNEVHKGLLISRSYKFIRDGQAKRVRGRPGESDHHE